MTGTVGGSKWRGAAIGALAAVLIALGAGPAQAAVYPGGGSTFTGGGEGWTTTSATCSVPLGLCSASGGYNEAAGNPAGSLAAKASITLNLGNLFNAAVSMESSDFKVADGGAGSLNLQRQFVPGGLVNLTPQVKYTATVVDKTAATETQVISETISAESGFASKGGAVTLVAGHTYAIRIDTAISSNVAGLGLLGESIVGFDNIRLSDSAGNNGEGGGNGGNSGSLTNSQLTSLVQSSLVGPAVLKGNRLFVKAKCPAKVGVRCKISVQGLLSRRKPATSTRTARVGKGKTKRFVLQVKPKARAKLVGRKRLLFKETVRAGSAKATVYRNLKLVRR